MSALKLSERAVEAFARAALDGTPQCRGQKSMRWPHRVEYCALGLLERDLPGLAWFDNYSAATRSVCPEPGCEYVLPPASMLAHLNDTHGWNWLDFARKLS